MSYYDKIYNGEAFSMEQAILAEDLKFDKLENIEGKFFIKVLTPTIDSSSVLERSKAGIKNINYITLTIPSYLLFQFMGFQIIKATMEDVEINSKKKKIYDIKGVSDKKTKMEEDDVTMLVATESEFTIPKGTIFFINFLSGQADADKAYIIGISPFKYVE